MIEGSKIKHELAFTFTRTPQPHATICNMVIEYTAQTFVCFLFYISQ